ncbi:MAG: hypothetical protein QY326_05590 [Bdellovibrionota bacterium]|nr:MAG: hypothetical protein QY326_05590 [Bdellovibrionota bacterium]
MHRELQRELLAGAIDAFSHLYAWRGGMLRTGGGKGHVQIGVDCWVLRLNSDVRLAHTLSANEAHQRREGIELESYSTGGTETCFDKDAPEASSGTIDLAGMSSAHGAAARQDLQI